MEGEEEGEAISHPAVASPPSPPPPPPPLPPATETDRDSQETLGFLDVTAAAAAIEGEKEEEAPSDAVSSSISKSRTLTDHLRDKIVRQVEYYFSNENLPTDKFLLKFVKKDKEGFVPIAVITSFRKMKKLVQDDSFVEAALRTSSQLVVSSDGKKVKRLHPLLDTDVLDAKLCTVLVENLPEDHSIENIQRIFGKAGKIKNISIRDPHASGELMEASKAGKLISSKVEKLISSKLHVFVEYDTVEAAENAVNTLNDEKDWRSGMRVELLMKRMGKFGLAPKIRKGTEKNNHPITADSADDGKDKFSAQHDETRGEEQVEHVQTEKAAHRGRNRGRGRSSTKHHNFTGQGHGSVPAAVIDGPSKPPLGPRMPDGTRGFTMGRGKPLPSDNP